MPTAPRQSILMMSSTDDNHDLVGDAIRADSYYGYTDGLHTVQVVYSNFTGNFGIQGTLEIEPTESDWFYINLNADQNTSSSSPLISYPRNPAQPMTYGTIAGGNQTGDTGTDAFTFVGNFTFLRAVLDRTGIPNIDPQNTVWSYGYINRVLLSL